MKVFLIYIFLILFFMFGYLVGHQDGKLDVDERATEEEGK